MFIRMRVCVCVSECECMHVCLVIFRSCFSTLYCLKSGHLMSLAITDDISEPVCLSQDRRTCLPARMRIIPLTSELKGNQ